MYFHEEEHIMDCLSDEAGKHFTPVVLTFAEGDSYLCEYDTSYESCTTEYAMDDPRYEDHLESLYDVTEVIKMGRIGVNLEQIWDIFCLIDPK